MSQNFRDAVRIRRLNVMRQRSADAQAMRQAMAQHEARKSGGSSLLDEVLAFAARAQSQADELPAPPAPINKAH